MSMGLAICVGGCSSCPPAWAAVIIRDEKPDIDMETREDRIDKDSGEEDPAQEANETASGCRNANNKWHKCTKWCKEHEECDGACKKKKPKRRK